MTSFEMQADIDTDEIPFELEEIVVGNMSFSLREYEYALAGESDVVELSEPLYRNVMRSAGKRGMSGR